MGEGAKTIGCQYAPSLCPMPHPPLAELVDVSLSITREAVHLNPQLTLLTRLPAPPCLSPPKVEAELVEERERAAREAERAREAIRQKEVELATIEAERKEQVRSIDLCM